VVIGFFSTALNRLQKELQAHALDQATTAKATPLRTVQ